MPLFGVGSKNTADATVRVNYDGKTAERGWSGSEKVVGGLITAAVLKQVGEYPWKLGLLGAQADTVSANFQNFADRSNRSMDSMMGKLKQATLGMVDDMTLQQQAMKAMVGGVKFDDLVVAMEFVTKFASATGVSVTEKMNTVMTGLARKSAAFLDDVGIQVMGSSDVVGDAIAQMTEKMDTFVTSEEDAAVKSANLAAELKNVKTEIGRELVPAFKMLNTELLDAIKGWKWMLGQSKEHQAELEKLKKELEKIE